MVTVRLGKYWLEALGHAGAGEIGKDTVCAAVSMLGYAGAGSILELDEAGLLTEQPVVCLQPGEIRLQCMPIENEEAQCRAETVFRVMANGICLLAATYPDNVMVTDDYR